MVDGVFFQHFKDSGIARVWRSCLHEWLKSGFAKRIVFLDRGRGPRVPGSDPFAASLAQRSAAADSLRLQRVCDEEEPCFRVDVLHDADRDAEPDAVYDLIPERMDSTCPTRFGTRSDSPSSTRSYACISENTAATC